MTAAMRTPKAPTPPRSSAAGGLEKEVEPEEREALEVLELLLDDELGRLDGELVVLPVEDGLPEDEVDVLFVSADLPAADAADVELEAEDVALVVPPGRVELWLDDPVGGVPERLLDAVLALLEAGLLSAPAPPGLAPPAEVLEGEPEIPGLSPTFSAVRSMVTGRLDEPLEVVELLPDLSEDPAPLPPEEDVPPEDFLSVAISSPPEPYRSQDLHYTHLFAKRYRCGKVFCALQKNDSPGSG